MAEGHWLAAQQIGWLLAALAGLYLFFAAAEAAMLRADQHDGQGRAFWMKRRLTLSGEIGSDNDWLAWRLGMAFTTLGLGWVAGRAVSLWLSPALERLGLPVEAAFSLAAFMLLALLAAVHVLASVLFKRLGASRGGPSQAPLWLRLSLQLLVKLLTPLARAMAALSVWIAKRARLGADQEGPQGTQQRAQMEIRTLLQEALYGDGSRKSELAMLDNVFHFSSVSAREVMVPRTEIVCLYAGLSDEDNWRIAVNHLYTRYPVCDPDKDHMIGYVHMKDMFRHNGKLCELPKLLRPILSLPAGTRLGPLLAAMKRCRTEMVLLIDEYGGTSGLVTMEDVLEQLVGELDDEFGGMRPGKGSRIAGRLANDA